MEGSELVPKPAVPVIERQKPSVGSSSRDPKESFRRSKNHELTCPASPVPWLGLPRLNALADETVSARCSKAFFRDAV
jgi:hypothetical protein